MAKKQRFEQIEGLPEALENKADKAFVDRIHVRNYAFISNLLERDVVVDENEFGTYVRGNNNQINPVRFSKEGIFKENTSYKLYLRGFNNSGNARIGIRYTDGTATTLFFPQGYTLGDEPIVVNRVTPANKTVDYIYGTYGAAGQFYIYDILFVEGSHFPGWIPAPEDQTADYSQTNPLLLSYIKNKPDLSNFATTNEINNIYDQLSAKANDRLSNVAYDLSDVEKSDIKYKIGIEKTSNYLDTDHLNNYGSGFFSGLVVDYSFFSGGIQEPDGKLYISALAEDGSYKELDKDVTQFSRHVVTQVGVSNVLVAEGIIKTSYSLTDFSKKSRDIYLVVLYNDTGATPLWRSISHIKEIRASFEGTAWLIGKLFIADNVVFFNVYPQII